jgi:uncharacterized protein (TIGR00369 family)
MSAIPANPIVPRFEPRDPDFERRVRASFARQTFMTTIGARILAVAPGAVEIELGHADHLLQQHGFIHAGAIVAAVDSAAGYAAMGLMPADAGVVTAELKINMLNPARSGPYRAYGRVLKPGRTLTVVEGRVTAGEDGEDSAAGAVEVLVGLFTMMRIDNTGDG